MDRTETEREMTRAAQAIIETLSEVGYGAPEGVIYAALMGYVTLDGFERVLRVLKDAGLVRSEGRIVTLTAKGEELAAKIREAKATTERGVIQ